MISIIYEDSSILVINKPSGMVVNRSETTRDEETLFDWILKNTTWLLGTPNEEFNDRHGVVHRLDKETSGLLIIAKDPTSFLNLQAQFKNHEVKKEYTTLVAGLFDSLEPFTVNAPLARNLRNRFKYGIVEGGRTAITNFVVNKQWSRSANSYALLSAFPETGRTHQIRVHLAALNHPVLGDTLYGSKVANKEYAKLLSKTQLQTRMFLHAAKIDFCHPVTGSVMHLESALPGELAEVISILG
ncbi:MAG: RluA family pseudouridine synthase [candidate division WWE3 bacterium]|nr:RluA family pseudouridine synthase [candidate division WWE3 bacterium]